MPSITSNVRIVNRLLNMVGERQPSPGTKGKATIAKPRLRVLRAHGIVRPLGCKHQRGIDQEMDQNQYLKPTLLHQYEWYAKSEACSDV